MAYKGKYKPKNPQKYKGNTENIIYRSLWERKVMVWLDKSPNIVWWTSEELAITYFNPVDKNLHKYYPDFVFLQKTNEKETKTVIEVNNSSLNPRGFRQNSKENYKTILKYCEKYEVPVVVNSDAHICYDVANFGYAKRFFQEIDFPKELVLNFDVDAFLSYLK